MVTAAGRLTEVSPSPSIRSARSIDSPLRFTSQGASPLRARMDAAEMTSLRRDVGRANERIRELQQSEKDAHLKLRVKDDLLKRLHEELKEKSSAAQIALEKEVEMFQTQVAQREADLLRSEEAITLLKNDNMRLAEMNRASQQAVTEAEVRAAATDARVAELFELQHQLEQQRIAYDRLLEQSTLAAKETSARDNDSNMHISRLEHDAKLLEERLVTAQETARVHESKAAAEASKQAEANRKLHDFEGLLMSLRSELDAQKSMADELARSKEANEQLKTKLDEHQRCSAMGDVRNAEQQRAIEKSKELEREMELKRNQERELTTEARNKIAELEVRVSTLTDELEGARGKLRMQAEEASEAQDNINLARVKANEDRLAREEEVGQLHDRVRGATERVTRVETERSALESELQRLRTAEVALKDDAKALRAKEISQQSLIETERSNFKRALEEAGVERKQLGAQAEADKAALMRESHDSAARVIASESRLADASAQVERIAAQLEQERDVARLAINDKVAEQRLNMERAQLRASELEGELVLMHTKLDQAYADLEHQKEEAARKRETDKRRHEEHIKELQARHSANLLSQDDAAAKAADAEHQVAYLGAQVTEMKDELEHMRAANQRTAALLEAERSARQQDLLSNQEKVSSISRQMLDTQDELVQTQNQLQRAADAQKTVQAELEIIQDAHRNLKAQMDKERDAHRKGQSTSAEDRRRDALRIVELKQELEESSRDLSDQRMQHRVLEDELEEERKRVSLLQGRYENGLKSKETALMDEQDRQTAARKRLAEEIHRLETDNEVLRDEKICLNDELIAKGKEMVLKVEETDSLAAQLRDAKAKAAEASQLEAEAGDLRGERSRQDAKEQALQTTLVSVHEGMRSLATQITALNNENARLKERIGADRATVSELVNVTLAQGPQ